MEKIIGRREEMQLLQQALLSKEAGLVAVYGRRRVGKTFLIHSFFKEHLAFELTGMYEGSLKAQLQQFSKSIQTATGSALTFAPPDNWINAFHALEQYLSAKNKKKKWVIFLDEFPWLDTRKSGFLPAFEHFWNAWASRQHNVLVIICGSAASWMIRNIVNNKGGLHNRITQKIRLLPFTLAETETYLKSRGVQLDQYQALQVYMAFGGIPQYLKSVHKGDSATQAIEKACFTKDGILTGEFNNLYNSLFEKADSHIKVVRALAATGKGLTRQEIIEVCGLSSGGRATLMLEELEESGFIRSAVPYEKAMKDAIYRLIDEYSLFYLKFMDKTRSSGKDIWIKLSAGASYKTWSGMAFEAVCMKHTAQIKKALGIEGIQTTESAWRYVPGKGAAGAQIDLLIDRADRCINICEIKYYSAEYAIDKSYAVELQRKLDVFKEKTKTKKILFVTMITTYGIKENIYSAGLVQKSLSMDVLFA
ncbi:MAG: ATP-binding protein [Chitinophagaceae bacterium]|nr:ATP-binding protein [Chitinophagaceae bacterium]